MKIYRDAIFKRRNIMENSILIFCLICNVFCACAFPFLYSSIFDLAIPQRDVHLLFFYLGLIFILLILLSISRYFGNLVSVKLGVKIINFYRLQIFNFMQNLRASNEKDIEEIILSRFSEDISILQQTVIFTAWTIAYQALLGLLSISLLLYLDFKLTLILAFMMPIIFIITNWFNQKAKIYEHEKNKMEINLFALLKEGLFAKELIRVLRLKNLKRKNFKLILKKLAKFDYGTYSNVGFAGQSTQLSTEFITVVVFGVGAYFVFIDQLTLGILIGFILLLGNAAGALVNIGDQYSIYRRGVESLAHIQQLLDHPIKIPKRSNAILLKIKNEILFSNVSAKYGSKTVISNVTIKLPITKAVGIIGISGSGKSTLIKLLLRELPLNNGRILFDGIDASHFSSQSLYRQIGIIYQQPKLLRGSIADNIRLGKIDATDAEVVAAAKLAEVHQDIINLPDGYETDLTYNTQVSGGQQQRIAIARALIANPDILCLDEATSALDPLTASALDETFNKLRGQITLLIVTHRLASTGQMDYIYVLDQGKIIEEGTPSELLARNGMYHQLWKKQHGVTLSHSLDYADISISWLKSLTIFEYLDQEILELLAKQFIIEKEDADKIIVDEGDIGNKFYIIVSGIVMVSKYETTSNQRKILAHLIMGDIFGEIALLDQVPRSARVTTSTPCIFLTLHRQQFNEIFARLPMNVQDIIKNMAKQRKLQQKDLG